MIQFSFPNATSCVNSIGPPASQKTETAKFSGFGMKMKTAPQQTDTSKFGGFSMKTASSSSAPGRPQGSGVIKGTAAAKAKAASGGMSSLFRDSMEDEGKQNKVAGLPMWSKPTMEAVKAQKEADLIQMMDPTAFQYDEVIDDEKEAVGIELPSQNVRTDVMVQKKKVGLVLREGVEACRTGNKRPAQYIEKVINTIDRRKVEQQIVEDRLLKKEQDSREGREVFVTEAFKDELKRRKKFEEELEAQEARDERRDAAKQENGLGFADFHRQMLNGGLSSGRGTAKVVVEKLSVDELAAGEDAVKKEAKEEEADEEMDEKAVKSEDAEAPTEQHGVLDVQAPSATPGTKAADKLAETEQRAEKAMSAKERFLARKKAAEEAAA